MKKNYHLRCLQDAQKDIEGLEGELVRELGREQVEHKRSQYSDIGDKRTPTGQYLSALFNILIEPHKDMVCES